MIDQIYKSKRMGKKKVKKQMIEPRIVSGGLPSICSAFGDGKRA